MCTKYDLPNILDEVTTNMDYFDGAVKANDALILFKQLGPQIG